jgi:hypothetical protein
MGQIDRRQLLLAATAGAAGVATGAAVFLDPVTFAAAAPSTGDPAGDPTAPDQSRTLTGHIDYGATDFVYIPVQVPAGVSQIVVGYSYDRPAPPAGLNGNALDIGIFDENGIDLGDARGFRGWSGGFRTEFAISASTATPGYLAGPIRPGLWHIIVGPYTVVPDGLNWTVTVTLSFGPAGDPFVPHFPPLRADGRGASWYRGDMHLHTVHSDGRRLPAEVAAGARAAELDFIVSTDHNTSSSGGVWGDFAGPDLLIINGEEVTTRNGHYTALGLPFGEWIDWRYRAVDGSLPRFLRDIHRGGALAVAAHPYAPCVGCAWKFGYTEMDAIEVWNGPWTPDDDATVSTWDNLLVAGARTGDWIPAVGDSDAHSEPQVIGLPHNVVFAHDLDRDSILAGVKAGRLWIAESAAVDLAFTAAAAGKQAGIGERLAVADDALATLTLTVSGAPGSAVRLISDQGQRVLVPLPANGTGSVTWTTTPRNARYVRAEVRRADNSMVALTNPIFLGRLG